MVTIEEQYFASLGHEIELIGMEIEKLEDAMNRPGGGRDREAVAGRIQAAARKLRQKLGQQSASLWMLFQDPARHSQVQLIQSRIDRAFDRILGLLRPSGESLGNDSLAQKVQAIQKLNKEIVGYRTLHQQSMPDASYWQQAPSRALEADPWSSLVLLSAILVDFVGVALRRPRK
jgi:hypothetical protein